MNPFTFPLDCRDLPAKAHQVTLILLASLCGFLLVPPAARANPWDFWGNLEVSPLSELDQLIVIEGQRPVFPCDYRENGNAGMIQFIIKVLPDGTVDPCYYEVLFASDERIIEPVINAALSLRFKPPTKNGELVQEPFAFGIRSFLDPDRTSTSLNEAEFHALLEQLDTPIFLKQVQPEYPFELKKNWIEGNVMLGIWIEPDGSVDPCRVTVVSSTHKEFIDPAIEAAKQSAFAPVAIDGVPFNTARPYNITYKFIMSGSVAGWRRFPPDDGRMASIHDEPSFAVKIPAEYPRKMKRRGKTGKVTLKFVISRDGQVLEDTIEVVESTNKHFLCAAKEALLESSFEPPSHWGARLYRRVAHTVTYEFP